MLSSNSNTVETGPTVESVGSRPTRTTLLAIVVSLGLVLFSVFGFAAYHFGQPVSGTGLTGSVGAATTQPPAHSMANGPHAAGVTKITSLNKPMASITKLASTRSMAGVALAAIAILLITSAAIITTVMLTQQSAVLADEEEPKGDVVVVEPNEETDVAVEGSSIVSILTWVFGGLAVLVLAVVAVVAVRSYRDSNKRPIGPVQLPTNADFVCAQLAYLFADAHLRHPHITYSQSADGLQHSYVYTPVPTGPLPSLTYLEVIIYALQSHKIGADFKKPTNITVTDSSNPNFDLAKENLRSTCKGRLTVTIDCADVPLDVEPLTDEERRAIKDSLSKSISLGKFWHKIKETMSTMTAQYGAKLVGKLNPPLTV